MRITYHCWTESMILSLVAPCYMAERSNSLKVSSEIFNVKDFESVFPCQTKIF